MSLFAANCWLKQRGKFESHLIASFEIGLSVGTTELVHSAVRWYHQEPIFLYCTIVSSLVLVLTSFWWLIICCTSRHYIVNINKQQKKNMPCNLTVIFLKTEDIFSWKQPSSLPFYVLLSGVGTMTDLDYLSERNRCFGSYLQSPK